MSTSAMNGNDFYSEISPRTESDKSQEDNEDEVSSAQLSYSPMPVSNPIAKKNKDKKKPAIRHAEKRRSSTCRFADRVAQLSVDHYKATIPIEKRPPQTCIATILAHYRKTGDGHDKGGGDQDNIEDENGDINRKEGKLWIVGMGVGTKFLSESCLKQELENEVRDGYGSRVRDMHAEVLARRAFRRQLTLEIQEDLRLQNEEELMKSRRTSLDTDVGASDQVDDDDNSKQGNILSILVRSNNASSRQRVDRNSVIRYMLRPDVTLHMYTSSAPCGNATLKKFCKMSKERFRDDLGSDEWPTTAHEPPPGSSVKLGEFSLLVKKDSNQNRQGNSTDNKNINTAVEVDRKSGEKKHGFDPTNVLASPQSPSTVDADIGSGKRGKRMRRQQDKVPDQSSKTLEQKTQIRRSKPWPSTLSDDWAPPGTTIVDFQHKGSIHTCSDKICRWNYLGLQGSLLAGLLEQPLYISTLTVGRKLSGSVCRRAICCRLDTRCRQPTLEMASLRQISAGVCDEKDAQKLKYRVNHPTVMGTSVYLDTSVVDTSNVEERGQDVRFHTTFVWSWWPGLSTDNSDNGILECIESSSGFLVNFLEQHQDNRDHDRIQSHNVAPKVSTKELTSLFLQVFQQVVAKAEPSSSDDVQCFEMIGNSSDDETKGFQNNPNSIFNNTLSGIREIKNRCSPLHEAFKDLLLKEHNVLSQWRRRGNYDK